MKAMDTIAMQTNDRHGITCPQKLPSMAFRNSKASKLMAFATAGALIRVALLQQRTASRPTLSGWIV
jgi:hypothetical protein